MAEVTEALAAIKAEGEFAIDLACGADDLRIDVEGVGPIRFPITEVTARKLCAVARPAPYGRRDKTLHDVRVRDTWEIHGSQIEIDTRRWQRTLEPRLAIIRQRLGLPEGGELEAVLDKMLVYGPGQFFAPHQDSERADDMVATLVVELPSRHEGGAIIVQHHRETKIFCGAPQGPKDLWLLAFYADCHHEVRPVEAGYRISLTYHLLYRGPATEPAPLRPEAVERLCAGVKRYFSTPGGASYAEPVPQRPDRLIYLLDHEYTQRSLGWGRLKNADRLRASALREVAARLDCEVFLALADVHECWSCEDDDDWRGGYRRRPLGRFWDDDGGAGDVDEHELIDLVDTDVELRHWVDSDGRVAPDISAQPDMREICFTRASIEMAPFKSEHEGYMGNYGNTVDRWYHRAAIVMWPRARNFVIRAKVSPSWAVNELASRMEAGSVVEARKMASELLPFWRRVARNDTSEAFVRDLLSVAAAFDDAELAFGLLSPLGPRPLSHDTTPAFIALVERFGLSWSQRVVSAWVDSERSMTSPWRSLSIRLCGALWAGGEHSKALATWLLSRGVASFQQAHTVALSLHQALGEAGLDRFLDEAVALLETAAVLGASAVRDDLIAFLTAPETAPPLMVAGALLRRCLEGRSPAAVRALGLQPLYRRTVALLERAVAAKPRSLDDWSIEPPPGCSCPLCRELAEFLRDRARIQYAWPLAKERRRHIHHVIDFNHLPVEHVTLRRGSPYKLVLIKQKALFERDAALRAQQKALLGWLTEQRSAFSEVRPSTAPS